MAFPQDVLPIRQELLIAGTWTSIVDDTENAPSVNIRRGYSGEQASLSAAQCQFTLLNPDGVYSNRNPLSPYYRLLGLNTQFRAAVDEGVVSLRLLDYSDLTDGSYDGATCKTTDKAVLDVTGDIDIRFDVEPDDWYGGQGFHLGSKYVLTGDQRSWAVYVSHTGFVKILWSTDGTVGNRVFVTSDEALPDGGRLAIRVTVDVNNGAAGNTTTFYTSDTIAGSWTQLGSAIVTAGTTSIFASTAPLEIGTISDGGNRATLNTPAVVPFCGRVYGMELRNGIGGTLVADMDATAQTAGATSWSDGLGTPNTWTLTESAALDDADYRFWGEVPKIPQKGDATGLYVTSAVTAADLVQRLGQGAKALNSPIYRNLARVNADGWWPMEDESASEQTSAVVGRPGYFSGASFGADDTLPGSAGALAFSSDDGYASGVCNVSATTTGTTYLLWYFKMPIPGSTLTPINFYLTGSTTYRIDIEVAATTYEIKFRNQAGTVLDSSGTLHGSGAEPGQWIAMRVLMNQNGSDVDWEWAWYPVGGATPYGTSGSYTSTVGRPRSWISYPYTGKSDLSLAHVLMAREDVEFVSDEFKGSTNGFVGEAADTRFARLCRENSIRYWIVGQELNPGGTASLAEAMGAQRPLPLLTLLTECAEIAFGFMYGPRDKFGLALRMRDSFTNREPVELDYSDGVLAGEELAPLDDDSPIRNDVTVSRPGGGFGRAVQTSGPRNVNDPTDDPDGVGTYTTALTRVAYLDARLPALAGHEKTLGTVDEFRWPKLQVHLAADQLVAAPALTAQIRRLDLGDPIVLTNLPAWVQYDDAEVIIRGYTELLMNRDQQFAFNTSPYSPYRLNDLSGSSRSRQRAAASNTSTATEVDSDDTTIVIKTPTGAMWRRSAGAVSGTYPLDARLGGEVVSVTACANVTLAFVAAGVVGHNSNDPATPGLPAGLLGGDLMLMLAAVRSTSVEPVAPAGWETMTSSANVALFGKLAAGTVGQASTEVAPTVTFPGTVPGDDTSAQIAAWRPTSPLSAASEVASFMVDDTWLTNASAQDIIYPGAGVRWPDNGLVLYLGWKQDDWTSVASPGTEIGEPDTTTGNDHGIVWAYTIQTTKTRIAPASFVVTGGIAAVSKGALVVIHPRHQSLTVVRSINGVAKTQYDEEVMQVNEFFRAGL
jgi:hypothetical protein